MLLGALVALALASAPPAPLISGGVYPTGVADVLVLYGGGATDEAQRRLIAQLRRSPQDEHLWGVMLALWWRRPPRTEAIEPVLAEAPPLVRELAAALWPSETTVGEESKEQRLARIFPALAPVTARHAGDPLTRALDGYLRSERDPAAALETCRSVLLRDPAMLPAARCELLALSALGKTKELETAVWSFLRSYPEDLGVAWRFFEDFRPPASHAERWPGLAPYLVLTDANAAGRRALERLLDDPANAPFTAEQLRTLLQRLSGDGRWWIEARPRLIGYLAAHPEHLADKAVRDFAVAADRTISATRLPYPSAEQRDARLLGGRALIAEGRKAEADALLREMGSRVRPVHAAAFAELAPGVAPLPLPSLADWFQPLFDREGRTTHLEATGRPRLVVITRGECRWTRKLAREVTDQDVTWVSQDVPDMQARALEYLQASGIDASKVFFTRSPSLDPSGAVDARMGVEVSPDILLFDGGGKLAREWEGWPSDGLRAALQEQLTRLAAASGAALEGTVIKAATGVTVEGARVTVELPSGPVAVESGRQGRFRVEGAPAEWLTVSASKAGIGWGRERVSGSSGGDVVLRLHPAGSIVGRVPVTDAEKRGAVRVAGLGRRGAVSEDGAFRIDDVPAGEARVEWVRPGDAGVASVRVTTVQVRAGEEAEAAFRTGASVAGRVTLRGNPIPGARLTWVRWEGDRPGGNLPTGLATAVTDDDGRYALDGLEPGPYTVAARAEGVGAFREALLIADHEQSFDVALRGETVEGRVVDAATSSPVAGARLLAFDASRTFAPVVRSWSFEDDGAVSVAQAAGALDLATTDAEGRFELLLPRDASEVEVSADGYLPATVSLKADRDRLSRPVALSRAATVRGVLLDTLGQPSNGGRVFVRFGALGAHDAFTISREDGSFRFDAVPAGPYDLVAAVEGKLAIVRGVAGPDDPASSGILVRLVDGGGLEVRGAAPAGAPDARALPQVVGQAGCDLVPLLALADDARIMPRLQPGEQGWTLRLPLVPTGDYLLRPVTGDAMAARVAPAQVTAVDLRLR